MLLNNMISNDEILRAFDTKMFGEREVDIQDTPLMDTIDIAAGNAVNENTTSFFTNIQATSGKTLADTTAPRNGELPNGEWFSILAIGLYVHPLIFGTDYHTILKQLSWTFRLGNRDILTGPIWNWPAGGGPNVVLGGAAASTAGVITNGVPSRESITPLKVPIVIQPGVAYSARLVGTSYTLTAGGGGGLGFRMTTIFRGLWARLQ